MLLVWLGPYATTMRARATFLTRACGDEATPSGDGEGGHELGAGAREGAAGGDRHAVTGFDGQPVADDTVLDEADLGDDSVPGGLGLDAQLHRFPGPDARDLGAVGREGDDGLHPAALVGARGEGDLPVG